MQPYSTEVYLPCEIPELSYVSRHKAFHDYQYESKISLRPMSIAPFLSGALIFIDAFTFFIEDFEMLLELNRKEKSLSQHLLDHPEWKKELEELNAVGGIRFIPGKNNLYFSSEAYAYKSQYEGQDWINFSLSPIVLEIDITNNCNAHCIHCSRDSGKSEYFMSFEKIRDILEQCKRFNIPELLVMGGEPLLHPNFEDIIKTARNYGIKSIRTSTNGILMTPEIAELLAECSVYTQVSIHGASAYTHEKVTQYKGSFTKACDAVKILRSKDVGVAISFTLLETNEQDIYEMPKLALDLGANSLRYLALSNLGRGKQMDCLTDSKRENFGTKLKEIYSMYISRGLEIAVGGFPTLTPISKNATLYGCAAGRTHLHIDHNGIVNPCGSVEGYYICSLENNKLFNADDKKYDINILDAWHNDKLKEIRHVSRCKCSYRFICAGACKADTNYSS